MNILFFRKECSQFEYHSTCISSRINKIIKIRTWNKRMMHDLEMDKKLNIDTGGYIDWPRGVNLDYFRTESTSYRDLDRLVEEYDLRDGSQLVDFGSGKGRIIFYLNHKLGIPATGIEVNKAAYSHLYKNLEDYEKNFPDNKKDVSILEVKAEEYLVKKSDDIFYFFNPFTVKIFEEVVREIENSLALYPRVVDIVLFYPNVTYTHFLEKMTSFHLIQTIKNPKYFINSRECFKVYRYIPS